jgi:hypothetical protein
MFPAKLKEIDVDPAGSARLWQTPQLTEPGGPVFVAGQRECIEADASGQSRHEQPTPKQAFSLAQGASNISNEKTVSSALSQRAGVGCDQADEGQDRQCNDNWPGNQHPGSGRAPAVTSAAQLGSPQGCVDDAGDQVRDCHQDRSQAEPDGCLENISPALGVHIGRGGRARNKKKQQHDHQETGDDQQNRPEHLGPGRQRWYLDLSCRVLGGVMRVLVMGFHGALFWLVLQVFHGRSDGVDVHDNDLDVL